MALVRVRYKGLSDVREISSKDLKGAGIKVDKTLVWSRENLFTVDVDAPDRLVEILKAEGHFDVSAIKDGGEAGTEVVKAEAEGTEEADVLQDATTGASTQTSRSR